jgi:DNA polymerase III subunit epsilon
MREIALDTETTGLDPGESHRVVEIACLELMNHMPTGRVWQRYFNPEREVPEDARLVHGLTTEFLKDKPLFAELADEFLEFIGDAPLIIHNAEFDLRFLNAELARLGRPAIAAERAIDTLLLARRKFPGGQASLDALCRRFEIDLSARSLHGALVDCDLLSRVYLELIGGRQGALALAAERGEGAGLGAMERPFRPPRAFAASPEELLAHRSMLARLKSAIWLE